MKEPAPMTEDMLQAHADILTRLGTSEEGARIRAQMQSASLMSDMQAFKAANPGCFLEDFVRWYSPNDWLRGEETEDEKKFSMELQNIGKEILYQKEGFDEEDGKFTENYFHDSSKNFRENGRLSLRMRVPGNIWQENWNNARGCPVRRQKRLFDETKEAEKVLHYLSGLRPAEVATQLLSSLFQASIRRISNAGDTEDCSLIDHLIKTASRVFDNSDDQIQLYKELFKDLQNIELRIARRKSLQSKLHASDLSETENKAFVTSLLDNPEVKVIGASRGAIGHVITRLFTEQQNLRAAEQDYDNHELVKKPAVDELHPFPPPAGREFIFRTNANHPSKNSRSCPQRMYSVLAGDEFRLAAAITSDSVFT
ncbi:rab3 GTPase-activating protein catalytic subunit-like [Xenia sp. Carnegie-2017]|uniref:rab3 GTPase-activating protein catalytic subunit-like n=1 Tax=Xenia sp. Carnegie-2017 TaxID=2897299 RepID=UPI001F039C97|nr:rab3 GTPase-activating protein catalytic subunit-like [Xenia sp. Carnegie-2017]